MRHLAELGRVVWLEVGIEELERRLGNAHARGIAMRPGQTLADLYAERRPLYERHAGGMLRWSEGELMEDLVVRLQRFLSERK